MSLISTGNEVASEVTKAAPPAVVTGLGLAGVTLNQWVMIATLLYTLMQMGWFIYSKFIRGDKSGS